MFSTVHNLIRVLLCVGLVVFQPCKVSCSRSLGFLEKKGQSTVEEAQRHKRSAFRRNGEEGQITTAGRFERLLEDPGLEKLKIVKNKQHKDFFFAKLADFAFRRNVEDRRTTTAKRFERLLEDPGLEKLKKNKQHKDSFFAKLADFAFRQNVENKRTAAVKRFERLLEDSELEKMKTGEKKQHKDSSLAKSADFAFRRNANARRFERLLEDQDPGSQKMKTGKTNKDQENVNTKMDPNQSSKRRVRRGSDPIHNRDADLQIQT